MGQKIKLFVILQQVGDNLIYRGTRVGTKTEVQAQFQHEEVDIVPLDEVSGYDVILRAKIDK